MLEHGFAKFARRSFKAILVTFAATAAPGPVLSQEQPVSILIVRHAESDNSQPTQPLSPKGRERVALLPHTLKGVRFTHIFATHTTRARETVEPLAAAQKLPIVQLPAPGSMVDGQPVVEQTSRRVPIEPVSSALMQLPPGSVAIAALNSENVFAILNKLGVPVAKAGETCPPGAMCVPCTDNSCYPRSEFDQIWHLVRQPGRAEPVALIEFRYGAGLRSAD